MSLSYWTSAVLYLAIFWAGHFVHQLLLWITLTLDEMASQHSIFTTTIVPEGKKYFKILGIIHHPFGLLRWTLFEHVTMSQRYWLEPMMNGQYFKLTNFDVGRRGYSKWKMPCPKGIKRPPRRAKPTGYLSLKHLSSTHLFLLVMMKQHCKTYSNHTNVH